jgi:ATP-dependent RNA helicase RhlE
MVFTRTKHGADRVVKVLEKDNVASAAIHGNKSQSNARERALEGFKAGQAACARRHRHRGARHRRRRRHARDPDGSPRTCPSTYVHRIGRTARAGASGIAWALCGADERALLRDIEREIRMKVPVVGDHPFVGQMPPEGSGGGDERPRSGGGGRGGRGGGGGGGGFGNRGGGGGGGRGGGGSRGGGGGGGGSRGGARSGDGARADTGGASSGGGGAGAGGGGGAGGGAPSRGVTWSFRPGGRRR